MNYSEFGRQLIGLRSDLIVAQAFYNVWLAIWPSEDAVDTLNQWQGSFGPVIKALNGMTILQLTEMFDKNSKAVSIPNLIIAARGNADDLIRHGSSADLEDWESRLSEIEEVLERLRTLRDQRVAHHDMNQNDAYVLKGELDEFFEKTKLLFNQISYCHSRTRSNFDQVKDQSTEDAAGVLKVLLEHRSANG